MPSVVVSSAVSTAIVMVVERCPADVRSRWPAEEDEVITGRFFLLDDAANVDDDDDEDDFFLLDDDDDGVVPLDKSTRMPLPPLAPPVPLLYSNSRTVCNDRLYPHDDCENTRSLSGMDGAPNDEEDGSPPCCCALPLTANMLMPVEWRPDALELLDDK